MEKDTKGLVGKIGSLTVKPSGRQIGRLAHSNPTVVFEVIIDSIQRMDNLAFFIADACRYLQSLSYEVLTYLLIEKLTGSQGAGKMKKKKLKDDGINNEDWLKGEYKLNSAKHHHFSRLLTYYDSSICVCWSSLQKTKHRSFASFHLSTVSAERWPSQ